eukprot:NODE_923_length_1136_cov_263.969641_g638_i0.p1 GENE.NODE_923_length_1136_cov_263.969641_g638_i0~~NODE_923_length_1136_cov_263.969641_g638_i0.p1  ORF type:complete len:288 (-),score=37.61 NODE_923_length_1136_cov_263.969641_g638_i0:217-1080(-)
MTKWKEEANLDEDDIANMHYLALHRVPETLDRLTKSLLAERPANPVEFMKKQLIDLRIANKAKKIEDYMNNGDPNFKISTDAVREIGKHDAHVSASDRDDSIRSESSTFSVNSVDMADFLQEFRQAYLQQTSGRRPNGRLTKEDLGEIIDYVAFPTPDKMLTDMFTEVDIDGEGSVEFEVFLARMNYKIQGRFGADILKSIFRSVALDNNVVNARDIGHVFHKLGLTMQDRDLSELVMRFAANKLQVTFEEFQRMVHHHTSCFPTHGLGLFSRGVPDSESRDNMDDN